MLLPGNESSCWADLLRSNRSVPGGPEPGGPEPGGPEPEAVGGPGPEAVVVPAVFGLIFVVGVVGNCLVMVVIGKVRHLGAGGGGGRRVLSPTNVFVLNLSVADLSFLLCCVPLHATVYSLPEWLFGSFLCWFGHFFSSVTMLVSIFTLVAMSVDRYVAVVRSNKSACVRSRRNALSGLCAIWTLSLLCSVPVAQHQVLTSHPTAPNSTFCWENWAGASRRAYRVTVLLLGFLLPLLLISCCYFRVLFHLHKKMKNMSKKSERSKRKTAQMVLLVVTAFAVCWMPHHIIVMWVEFGSFPLTDASFAFRIVSHCLSYGNSCVNPVLYAFLSENFRKACCQVFTCYLSSQPPPPSGKVVRFHLDTFSSTHSTTNI
ncbi:galanin receptor type 1b isoform X3 [Amphiprion ocellaris]|uniref:galanin receptor type 1b isoform X3 n=1 Tax=Amphiprion ocellaris TaxID=80972 RepID=UPI000C318E2F|nr:galanin receptor type 1b isoform X3 [Amphiprion ocellaris]